VKVFSLTYNNEIAKKEVLVMFWLILCSELITKYLFYYTEEFHRIGLITKVIIGCYCIKAFFIKDFNSNLNKWIVFFFITGLIGALTLSSDIALQLRMRNFIFSILKYLFPLFIYIHFIKKLEIDTKKELVKHLGYAIIINACLILFSILFKIEIFKSYVNTDRFGYDGYFFRSWTASYVYLIAIISFLHFKTKFFKILLVIAILSGLVLGTKLFYLGLALILTYQFFKYKLYYNKAVLVSIFTSLLALCFTYNFLLKKIFKVLYAVYLKEGLVTTFFSYRNLTFKETIIPYVNEYWSFLNYIFGSGDNNHNYSEIGIIDIYLMFGVMGMLFVNLFYYQVFKKKPILFFVFFLGVFFSGNFFHNPTVTFSYFFALAYLCEK